MEVLRYKTHRGTFPALHIKDGRKLMHLILMDSHGIRVTKVPLSEARYMTVLDYRVSRAKRLLRAAGKKFGITKEARAALRS